MIRAWARIEVWLRKQLPELLEDLRPGAEEEQVRELEDILGVELPRDFRESLLVHDGQQGRGTGLVYGLPLMSIDGILREWGLWREMEVDDELQFSDLYVSLDHIREQYTCERWVPFCRDGGGNFLGLDLDPPVGGFPGQIINFGPDEQIKRVIAPDFRTFLTLLADDLDDGRCVREGKTLRLAGSTSYLDGLHDERHGLAREWLTLSRQRVPQAMNAGKTEEALRMAEQALALARRIFPAGHPNLRRSTEQLLLLQRRR